MLQFLKVLCCSPSFLILRVDRTLSQNCNYYPYLDDPPYYICKLSVLISKFQWHAIAFGSSPFADASLVVLANGKSIHMADHIKFLKFCSSFVSWPYLISVHLNDHTQSISKSCWSYLCNCLIGMILFIPTLSPSSPFWVSFLIRNLFFINPLFVVLESNSFQHIAICHFLA